jgi:hypothetical protein
VGQAGTVDDNVANKSSRPRRFRRLGAAMSNGSSLDTLSYPITCTFLPNPEKQPLPFDTWVTVWKTGVTRILKVPELRWHAGTFHHRIRSYEDYNEKLNYMHENPVKAGLVERIEDWPYRGEVFQRYHWWP